LSLPRFHKYPRGGELASAFADKSWPDSTSIGGNDRRFY
jgi:hypothetical protein